MNIHDDKRPPQVKLWPVEALHAIVNSWSCMSSDSKKRWPKPGAIIEQAPAHIREALKNLTSDEAAKLRFDPRMI